MIAAGQRFCGVAEPLLENATLAKWPTNRCSYAFAAYLGAIGREAQLRLTALAWAHWMSICGVAVAKTADPTDANIVIGASRRGRDRQLDGPSGVLAYCGLPLPGVEQVPLVFDLDETWTAPDPRFQPLVADIAAAIDPGGAPTVEAVVAGVQYFFVALHEGGHGLGIGHAPVGSDNVMAPTYNPRVTTFGSWEREEAIRRYGPPVAPPPTPTAPTSPDDATFASMRVLIGDRRYRLVQE